MKLLFFERLKKHRVAKGLTQEQLANALTISPQSVSKWERGDGYPDITLLPRIANFFQTTVDELIGNDETTQSEDIENFQNRYWKIQETKSGFLEKLILAKEYYQKYPWNFDVMNALERAIVNNMEQIDENISLLHELHEKIMSACTNEKIRRDSIHRMCYTCSDEELEQWITKSELDWAEAVNIGVMIEKRLLLQKRYKEYYTQRNSNDLLIFMQYLARNNMQYYGESNPIVFNEPLRTAEWELHKMQLLESFDVGDVPEAWCGCYAESSLKAGAALIGCGKVEVGIAQLEKTFSLYERWLKIPDGKLMDVGCPEVFGNAKISKFDRMNKTVYAYFENGTKTWVPYLWLFWQLNNDIYIAMRDWVWFDDVRDTQWFEECYEKAKRMAVIKEE